MTSSKPSRVYFARRGEFIKIGCSADVPGRVRKLRASLLLAIPGGRDLERRLHSRFRSSALGGEWFRPSPELLAYIKAPDLALESPALPRATSRAVCGQRLQMLRQSHGHSQAGLAAVLGVRQATVARWESGDREPTLETRLLLAGVLGFDPFSIDTEQVA